MYYHLRCSGAKICVYNAYKVIFWQMSTVISAWYGQRRIGVESYKARNGKIIYNLVTRYFVGHNWETGFFFFLWSAVQVIGVFLAEVFKIISYMDSHWILVIQLEYPGLLSPFLKLILREVEWLSETTPEGWHRV